MVRLLVSKVAARSSARCLPLPCSSRTIAKRRSVRFICSPLTGAEAPAFTPGEEAPLLSCLALLVQMCYNDCTGQKALRREASAALTGQPLRRETVATRPREL